MTQKLRVSELDDRHLPPGEVIADRFEIGDKIGEGPFGQVYRASDTLVETDVAVKVFSTDVVDTPLDEEQFLKATRRARALTQKNVVRLHDSGVHKDHPWVSMQLLEGLNLRKVARLRWQRQESFSVEELEPVVSQVTLALQHIGRDHPHGNLKPENVIFLPDLLKKVTDSYVLAALDREVFAEANEDSPFVAPELLEGHTEPDTRCDVYSVGALIGFALFGPDYEPGAETDAPGAMAAVNTLCERAMAEDPDDRYRSVEELNEDFTSIVDTGALLQRRPSAGEEPVAPSAPVGAGADTSGTGSTGADSMGADSPQSKPAPEESVDPLDMETPADIGMPLEEDVQTTEFDREENAELGDYLPTNEVDRDHLRTNEVAREQLDIAADAAESAQQPTETEEQPGSTTPPAVTDRAESPPEQPEKEPEETSDEAPSSSDTDRSDDDASATPPKEAPPTASRPDDRDSSGLPTGGIVAAAVLVVVFVAAVLALPGDDDETDTQQTDDQPTAAQADDPQPDDDEVADQPDEEPEQQDDEPREDLMEAFAAASPETAGAIESAEADAEEEYERLQEQQEEEEEAAGAGTAPGGAAPAGGGECPSGMARMTIAGEAVCIDRYQYPGRGRRPETNVSTFDARRLCEQQDKRLCTLQEWRGACGTTYPYGASYDPDRCNTADADGIPRQIAETGSFGQCRSHVGAYDMSGNVHEWVDEGVVVGGAYDSREDTARCDYQSSMSPDGRRDVGFRCCASPS